MCGIGGIAALARDIPFEYILKMLKYMEMRGTEHGAGFAAYSPTENGLVRFRFFATNSNINSIEKLVPKINGSMKRIALLHGGIGVYETYLDDYPSQEIYKGVWVLQASRYLEIWKGIGWPYSVAEAYGLWGLTKKAWLGHTRYPTNSPGFKPWLAHPFSYRETVIVHNGDLSSYGANKRYVEAVLGIENFTGNDSEVIAYIMQLLFDDGYTAEDVVEAVINGSKTPWIKLDGPFAVAFIHGTSKGPIFGAFVDKHHLRPLYVALNDDVVYVASEAGAIKAVDPKAKPSMLRGSGMVIMYPDGEKVIKGLTEYKVYLDIEPLNSGDGIDADDYVSSAELNKASPVR